MCNDEIVVSVVVDVHLLQRLTYICCISVCNEWPVTGLHIMDINSSYAHIFGDVPV